MDHIEHRVRERAYYIWEGEGRVHGRADAHWLRAEAEIADPAPTVPAVEAIPAKAPRKAARTKAVDETTAEVKAVAKKPAKAVRTVDIATAVPEIAARKVAAPKIAAPKTAAAKAAPKAAASKAAKAVKALVAVGTKAKPARADLH